MLNRDFIGRSYPAGETYEVSRELIRRFAQAIGDNNPIGLDRAAAQAAGYRDVVAPPTFLTVLAFRFRDTLPFADPELGLNYAMVVHGEQRFVFERPIVAGDVLTVVNQITDIRVAGRNELLVTDTIVTDPDGQAVATLSSTMVSRGTATA